MTIARREHANLFGDSPPSQKARNILGEVPDPVALRTHRQNHLLDLDIRQTRGHAKTEKWILFGEDSLFVDLPPQQGHGAAEIERSLLEFVVLKKGDVAPQVGQLLIECENLKPAAALGQDIEPPIRIPPQNLIDRRRAAGIGDPFFGRQNHPELPLLPDGRTDHVLVAFLEDVEGQRGLRKQNYAKREKGEQHWPHGSMNVRYRLMQIRGAVTIVTGASEGIGRACVEEFRQRGAQVVLTARNEAKLRSIAQPGELILPADLTDPAARAGLLERVRERHGRVDILINNAGLGLSAPSWRAQVTDTRYLFELNFFAPLDLAQQAVADMKPRRTGAIINIGSVAGRVAMPWFSLYSASKFALGAWTSGMRMELAADNIHAMVVCPGFVRTEFHRHTIGGPPPGALKRGRPAEVTPAEVARRTADGLERRAHTVVVPRIAHLLIAAGQLFPKTTERVLTRSNAEMGEA